jgi:Lrp/AsnC family transcriptional regulator for asnA, asnC and gidA
MSAETEIQPDALQRATFAELAAAIFPGTDGHPAAGDVGIEKRWLDRALDARPDLAPALLDLLDELGSVGPERIVATLKDLSPESRTLIADVAIVAYYMHPRARKGIGYPGQRRNPIAPGESDYYLRDGLLSGVYARGSRAGAPSRPGSRGTSVEGPSKARRGTRASGDANAADQERFFGPVGRAQEIDDLDRRIIEALQIDGRESFRSIAAQLGVAEGTVRKRYAQLRQDRILQVVGITNPLGLGFEALAMVGVRISGSCGLVADEIATWGEASYVVAAAGRFDLLVEVVCTDHDHLLEVTDRMRNLAGVISTETLVYLRLTKQMYNWGIQTRTQGNGAR